MDGERGKIYHGNTNQKKAGVAILISDNRFQNKESYQRLKRGTT